MEKAIHRRNADQSDRRRKLASHPSHRSCLERHGFAIIRIQSTPFEAQSIDVNLHVHLSAVGKLPVATGLGDLSQLGVSVKRLRMRRRPLAAKEVAGDVGGVLHGHGRSGEEGPDVVDFLIVEGNGNVVEPREERSVAGLETCGPGSTHHGSIQSGAEAKEACIRSPLNIANSKLLTREEFSVDSRLHDSTFAGQQREQSRRVTHAV